VQQGSLLAMAMALLALTLLAFEKKKNAKKEGYKRQHTLQSN
jgi:hypothetical protein